MACSAWARKQKDIEFEKQDKFTYKQWILPLEFLQIVQHLDIAFDWDHRSIYTIYIQSLLHHYPHQLINQEYLLSYFYQYLYNNDTLLRLFQRPRKKKEIPIQREKSFPYSITFITSPIIGHLSSRRMHITIWTFQIMLSLFQPTIGFWLLIITFSTCIWTFFYKIKIKITFKWRFLFHYQNIQSISTPILPTVKSTHQK